MRDARNFEVLRKWRNREMEWYKDSKVIFGLESSTLCRHLTGTLRNHTYCATWAKLQKSQHLKWTMMNLTMFLWVAHGFYQTWIYSQINMDLKINKALNLNTVWRQILISLSMSTVKVYSIRQNTFWYFVSLILQTCVDQRISWIMMCSLSKQGLQISLDGGYCGCIRLRQHTGCYDWISDSHVNSVDTLILVTHLCAVAKRLYSVRMKT